MSKKCCLSIAATAIAALLTSASAFGQLVSNGPDVLVGDLPDISNYTPLSTDAGFDAFSVGTTSCNRGNAQLNWYTGGTDNRHPVIGQNLFRFHNGRFEHIGQAWLKHGFLALQGNVCAGTAGFPHASCTNSNNGGVTLGVGCSDPYSSGLNGQQSGLGPKWQVNAAQGLEPYPYSGSPAGSSALAGRLVVRTADLDPATYPGAKFYVEGQYVCGDDAAFKNKNNNASYREVTFSAVAASGSTPAHYNMNFASGSSTVREIPAIFAATGASFAVADVVSDGRYILATRVTGPVSGVYTYEYALHNLNSDRCAGSFAVPFPSGASITSLGFHDVDYHSGEPNDNTDWSSALGATSVTWSGAARNGAATIATWSPGANLYQVANWVQGAGNDHSANVLRWGTLYNFRFQSTTAPVAGRVQATLWRPGTPTAITFITQTPGGAVIGSANTGTCCVGTTCSVTTQTACTGTFGVIGSTCTADPCPPLTGACCAPAGTCTVTTSATCSGGTYQGDNSTCTPNPCPLPTGACCSAAGACSIATSATCNGTFAGNLTVCASTQCSGACCNGATCSITGQSGCTGSYLGGGTTCTASICNNNNLCSAPVPLCDGVPVNGNNTTATTDGAASCVSSSNNDVWYSYRPSGTSGTVSVRFTTDNSVSATGGAGGTGLTDMDTVLSVHTACGTADIGCDDDGGNSPGNSSNLVVTLNRGQLYLVRVSTYGTFTPGNFTLKVIGGTGTGCNPTTGSCCTGTACSVTTATGCGAGVFASGGTCTPNPCDPSGACCHQGGCNVINQTGCSSGSFTTGGTCVPNICPPTNDDCLNRPGTALGTTAFDTTFATTDGIAHNPGCLFFSNDQITNDLWYNFPAGFTGTLRIDTCGSTFDTKLAAYSGGTCVDFASRLLACDDDNAFCGSGSNNSMITINVVAGNSYTIRVGGYNGAVGAGVLNLTNTTPNGACCTATACSITTSTGCTGGTFQGLSTTCGPVGNPTTCCKANFNATSGVGVQDIFDFLAAWFNMSPAADINGADGVTVQDIFDFLALWFAGCPG